MSFVVLVQAGRHLLEILTDDGMMDEMNNNNMHDSGSVFCISHHGCFQER